MKENSINKKEVDNGIKINIPIISNQEIENTINTENLYDKIAKQIYHDREMIILQEFIKKLQKENEILKEEKEQAWEEWNNLEQGSYGTEQKLKQQIKELKKENEELKFEERRRIIGKYGDAEIHDVINKILSNDYIPVQKVKDNIKKLEIKKEKARGERNILERFAIEKSINSLQELLESEE